MQEKEGGRFHSHIDWAPFEKLLLSLSSQFISLPFEQIDGAIEETQRQMCEALGFDLSALWQWSDKDRSTMTLTHLFSPPGGPQRPAEIDGAKTFPWALQKMQSGETLAYSTDQLTETAALDKDSRNFYGIKSSVNIPLMAGGALIGILTFDTLWENRTFETEEINRLKIVAEIVNNTLARKLTEERLIESETRFTLATNSAGAGIWELDVSTNVFWATDKALAIFGYDSKEVISMERFERSVYPGDLEYIREAIFCSLHHGEPLNVEYRILTDDGSLKWISSSGRAYFKSSGEPERLLGVSVDITERKLSAEKLKETETTLRNSQRDLQRLAGQLIAVKEEELCRLSRELHDDLSQRLAVLAIEAGKLELELTGMERLFPEPIERIGRIKEQLIKVSEDVHRISRQLHPTILDDLGLVRAIESELEALKHREDLLIIFKNKQVPNPIPSIVSLCIYRIIQEGLNNVIRHSGAKRCVVDLSRLQNTLCLTITDKGIGFDPEEVRHKPGLGLSSMRERVLFVQGDFSIDSQLGKGTEIKVSVPLNEVLT